MIPPAAYEAAFTRAREKYFRLVRAPALNAFLPELISFPPARRPDWRGPAHVIDGRSPVREINGAVLADQRVRWKPDPPTFDVSPGPPPPDFKTGRARSYVGWERDERGFNPAHTTTGELSMVERMRLALKLAIAATLRGPDRDRLERKLKDLGG